MITLRMSKTVCVKDKNVVFVVVVVVLSNFLDLVPIHMCDSKHSAYKQTLMSRLMTKPIKWHVRPAKTQIRLGIRIDTAKTLI